MTRVVVSAEADTYLDGLFGRARPTHPSYALPNAAVMDGGVSRDTKMLANIGYEARYRVSRSLSASEVTEVKWDSKKRCRFRVQPYL